MFWDGLRVFFKVTAKLQQLHEDGLKLLIMSNQNGIEAKKVTVQQFQVGILKMSIPSY